MSPGLHMIILLNIFNILVHQMNSDFFPYMYEK